MTYNQYQDLRNDELARHHKILSELEARMTMERQNCPHSTTLKIGEFVINNIKEIQVQCQHCGYTFSIKNHETLHTM